VAKPNVVIVTFDCLRPDRLGFAGYRGVDTPAFDQLAEESLVFENAYCQGPNTWISHASMFTGSLPAVHGVRTPLREIHPQVRTLAEVLKAAGYATFGLPAMSLLSEAAGFGRGFDRYDLSGLQGHHTVAIDHRYLRSTAATLEAVEDVVQAAPEPFLLWVHHFGLHYVEPALLELPGDYRSNYSEYAQHYDAKVSYADHAFLKPLLRFLDQRQVLDRTLLVLWSDHGEDLADVEHKARRRGHNLGLEEEVVRTLLMVRTPGCRTSGRRRRLASSTDILPTVCEACEVPCPPTVQGNSLLAGAGKQSEQTAYFENLCQGFLGLRRGEWKAVLAARPTDPERMSLGQKVRWRWELTARTVRTVLSTSHTTPPGGGRRKKGGLVRWWPTGQEPEQTARALLDSGERTLWRCEGRRALPADDSPEAARLLESLLARLGDLALPSHAPQHRSLDQDDLERVQDTLSALGYM